MFTRVMYRLARDFFQRNKGIDYREEILGKINKCYSLKQQHIIRINSYFIKFILQLLGRNEFLFIKND